MRWEANKVPVRGKERVSIADQIKYIVWEAVNKDLGALSSLAIGQQGGRGHPRWT